MAPCLIEDQNVSAVRKKCDHATWAIIDYVLKDFAKADGDWLAPLFDAIAREFPRLAAGDADGFMSRVAFLTRPPRAEPAAGDKETKKED